MRLLPLCLFALFLVPGLLTGQSSIIVTSSADSGPGTLRQAVSDIDVGGTITFDVTSVGLDTTLVVDKDLTIDGGDQRVYINSTSNWRGPNNQIYFTNSLVHFQSAQAVFQSLGLGNNLSEVLLLAEDGSSLEFSDVNLNCLMTCVTQKEGEFYLDQSNATIYTGSPTFDFDQTDSVIFQKISLSYDELPLGDRGGGMNINTGDVLIEDSYFASEIINRGAQLTIRNSTFGSAWAFDRGVRALLNVRGNYKIIRSTAAGLGISQSAGLGEILDSIVRPGHFNHSSTNAVDCDGGSLKIWNSTIRGELSSDLGPAVGGLNIASNCSIDLYSSIVFGVPALLDAATTPVENRFNIISDPVAGPFVNLLLGSGSIPHPASPVVDQGDCSLTNSVFDRLNQARPLDLSWPDNAPNGDGCDIGAVELQNDNRIASNLAAKVLLAGAWDGSSMRNDLLSGGFLPLSQPYAAAPTVEVEQAFLDAHPEIVDWVYLELRTTPTRPLPGSKRAIFVTENGDLLSPNGGSLEILSEPGQYYVLIRHRNHLAIMSASTLDFSIAGQNLVLDLTSDPNQIYTDTNLSNAPYSDLGNGVIGMWQGDVNGSSEVKYSGSQNDRVLILDQAGGPSPFDFVTGYLRGDVNLDGKVSYSGAQNDRVEVLEGTGGPTAFDRRKSHVPSL